MVLPTATGSAGQPSALSRARHLSGLTTMTALYASTVVRQARNCCKTSEKRDTDQIVGHILTAAKHSIVYGVVPKGLLTFLGFLGSAEFSPWRRNPEFLEVIKKFVGVFVTASDDFFGFVWKKLCVLSQLGC